jgi:transcriptional regulator with XRE-family HTH domain
MSSSLHERKHILLSKNLSREKLAEQAMEIGQKIKRLRESKGLSRKEFYEMLGITSGYLTQIEKGQRTPAEKLLLLIERTYGADLRASEADFVLVRDGVAIGSIEVKVVDHAPPYIGVDRRKDPELRKLIDRAILVLRSKDEVTRDALRHNIIAFHRALEYITK